MLFFSKKIIGGILQPLPLLLLIMGVAILLLWFSRWQRCGKILFSGCWLALLLLSLQPVADFWLKPLEDRYATYQGNDSFNYIIVLGGGYTYNPAWAPSSNLLNNSLPRVTEGVRLYLQHPGKKLVFSGAATADNPMSNAKVASLVAISLGVPTTDTILLETARDTEEEAIAVKELVGEQPVLLVTSANHLPRAMQIFQQQGLKPIPAAANQLAIDSPLNAWEKALPSALYLMHAERAWYETLGRAWLALKNWTKGAKKPPVSSDQP